MALKTITNYADILDACLGAFGATGLGLPTVSRDDVLGTLILGLGDYAYGSFTRIKFQCYTDAGLFGLETHIVNDAGADQFNMSRWRTTTASLGASGSVLFYTTCAGLGGLYSSTKHTFLMHGPTCAFDSVKRLFACWTAGWSQSNQASFQDAYDERSQISPSRVAAGTSAAAHVTNTGEGLSFPLVWTINGYAFHADTDVLAWGTGLSTRGSDLTLGGTPYKHIHDQIAVKVQ